VKITGGRAAAAPGKPQAHPISLTAKRRPAALEKVIRATIFIVPLLRSWRQAVNAAGQSGPAHTAACTQAA
jgi:hypothetical protein